MSNKPFPPMTAEDARCQRAEAWTAITKVLDEVSPGWNDLAETGIQSAELAIRALAAQPVAQAPDPQAIKDIADAAGICAARGHERLSIRLLAYSESLAAAPSPEASKPVQAEAPRWLNVESAMEDPVFQQARAIMGTENWFQDNALRNALNYVLRAALATQPLEQKPVAQDADMFWDHDDPETFGHDIEDIIQDYGPGDIVKIDQARRLPTITVRVLPPKDDNSYQEFEVIEDDRAARASGQEG